MFGIKRKKTGKQVVSDELTASRQHLTAAIKAAAATSSAAAKGAYSGARSALTQPHSVGLRRRNKPDKDPGKTTDSSSGGSTGKKRRREHPSTESATAPATPATELVSFGDFGDFRGEQHEIVPLVNHFMRSVGISQVGKETAMLEAMDKRRAKDLQKEAKRRANAVAAALRGERRRRWPLMVAAFAVGTAVGAVASMLIRQGSEGSGWTKRDLQDVASKAKDKISDATSKIADKTGQAGRKIADKTSDMAESMREKGERAADKTEHAARDLRNKSDDVADSMKDKAREMSKNNTYARR